MKWWWDPIHKKYDKYLPIWHKTNKKKMLHWVFPSSSSSQQPILSSKVMEVDYTQVENHAFTWLINTLPITEQDCLLEGTINAEEEERMLNNYIARVNKNDKGITPTICIYGRNSRDKSVLRKANVLVSFGFCVCIYSGGLCEWILLQKAFGADRFRTTSPIVDTEPMLRKQSVEVP
jgi:hypothetical protein